MKLLKKALFLCLCVSVTAVFAGHPSVFSQKITIMNDGLGPMHSGMDMSFQATPFALNTHTIRAYCTPVACSKIQGVDGSYYQTITPVQPKTSETFIKTVEGSSRSSSFNYFVSADVGFGLKLIGTQSWSTLNSQNNPLQSSISVMTSKGPIGNLSSWATSSCVVLPGGQDCSLNPYTQIL